MSHRCPKNTAAARRLPHPVAPLALAAHLALASMAAAAFWVAPAHAAETATAFDIPAGALNTAIHRFVAQSGVFVAADGALTEGRSSPGLQGRHAPADALGRLLLGTGLGAVRQADGSYALRMASPPPPRAEAAAPPTETVLPVVTVKAAAESDGGAAAAYRSRRASVGVLGERALKDTPYSIEVYSRESMDNKQAVSLADAVKGDAAIQHSTNGINGTTTELIVRGATVDFYNNYKLDGMSMLGWGAELPLEHYEHVVVLKGAGGFLYGFGAPGAIVNYVSKRPASQRLLSAAISVNDSGTVLLHGDVGGRAANGVFGYRINVVGEKGDTYVDDGGKVRRGSASVAADWRVLPDLVWGVDALHSDRKTHATYFGITPADDDFNTVAAPAPIDGSKRIVSSFTNFTTRLTTYGTHLIYDLAPKWQARGDYRSFREDRATYYSRLQSFNATGDYAEYLLSGPGYTKTNQLQAIISGQLTTGAILHDIVVGASSSQFKLGETGDFRAALLGSGNLSEPINAPDPQIGSNWDGGPGSYLRHEKQRAMFASDTMRVGPQWDVTVGLRRNNLKTQTYDKGAVTPTLGVVFRPQPWISTYASYIESLEQGGIAPLTPGLVTNPGEVFGPAKSKQAEIGVKLDGDDWAATAALFRIMRPLQYVNANRAYTQDGESEYNGLEIGVKARLAKRWMLNASAVILDAKNKKTTDTDGDGRGDLDGKRVPGVSRGTVAAYAEYTLPQMPLVLAAGGRYVTSRNLDSLNKFTLSSYALFDLGARYTVRAGGKDLVLRFNIDNVAGKAHWLGSEDRLTQGAPRTFKVGAQMDF